MILSDRKIRNLSPKAGDPGDAALVLERVFDAPPAAVFSLWSDPVHVREWWHPAGYTTPVFEMDFRVGGVYRYCIRKDGQDGWAHGVYKEIDVPRRLVFSFQWQSGNPAHDRPTLITLNFDPVGADATRLTFRQEPFDSDDARHSHGQGWTQVLQSFAIFIDGREAA